MALSDFMPYGAPELLDAAPERMAHSTMLASLGVALLVASLGTLLSRQLPALPEIPVEPKRFDWIELEPPPPTESRTVPPAEPTIPTDRTSIPVPRPDEVVPHDDFTKLAPADGKIGDVSSEGQGSPGDATTVPPCSDPLPNEFRYVDEMPVMVRSFEPRYPDLARQAGVEGTVTVQMLVGLDGRVQRAIIAPRGSVLLLDEAALEAARRCVFTPALANGHPVKVWVSQQYRFRLH